MSSENDNVPIDHNNKTMANDGKPVRSKITDLRNYGVALSDAESRWPESLIKQMRKAAKAIVLGHLGFLQRIHFFLGFLAAKYRARKADLSSIRAKGMINESFLATQIEYISMFSALAKVLGVRQTEQITKEVMNATAKEALLLCLPEASEVRCFPDAMTVFREYLREGLNESRKAGCLEATIAENSSDAFQFNVTWCVWLELARLLGAPEACKPNCYSDDLVFPAYFNSLGIDYRRTQTLACGGACCDFRFEMQKESR